MEVSGADQVIGAISLAQLSRNLGGELSGGDVMFSNVSTDTRSLQCGDLYLALVGENFDGNAFVTEAESRGACAAVTSRESKSSIPTLLVEDTHIALGEIANLTRRSSAAAVVALTGSQGKTTVKEMLHAILSSSAECLATAANLNNTIGVPLTLLQIEEQHEFVVVEMGANSAGEIAFSVAATEPNIALITNASAAHIEGFGSLQGIVEAKGEIIDGLRSDGVMVLNADDAHVKDWAQRAEGKKVIRFSMDNGAGDAHYFASDIEDLADGTSRFNLNTPAGSQQIETNFLGRHNVLNAVAAAAAAMEAGASIQDVRKGLSSVGPVAGRLAPLAGLNGCRILDDSYNASPGSFFAAIDVLSACEGQKILVMGDMKELGEETDSAHRSVGEYAAAASIDALWATGEKSKLAVQAYQGSGKHYETKDALIAALQDEAGSDLTILIKGSRGAQMNQVVTAMKMTGEAQC